MPTLKLVGQEERIEVGERTPPNSEMESWINSVRASAPHPYLGNDQLIAYGHLQNRRGKRSFRGRNPALTEAELQSQEREIIESLALALQRLKAKPNLLQRHMDLANLMSEYLRATGILNITESIVGENPGVQVIVPGITPTQWAEEMKTDADQFPRLQQVSLMEWQDRRRRVLYDTRALMLESDRRIHAAVLVLDLRDLFPF